MGQLVPLPGTLVGGDMVGNTILNTLLPMHVQIDLQGRVRHVGPTFMKHIGAGANIVGDYLFDHLQFSYPKPIISEQDLAQHYNMPLTMQIKNTPALI